MLYFERSPCTCMHMDQLTTAHILKKKKDLLTTARMLRSYYFFV